MKIKKILTFVFAAALMTSCGNEDGPGGDGGNSGGTEHTEYFGVNMSGAEFGNVYPGVDGTHYGYPTKKDLEYFKEKGLRMIRFPFRWERIQSEMNGPLITTELAKMKEFVQAAEDLNMKVLLDRHTILPYKTTFAVFFQPFDKRPQTSHTALKYLQENGVNGTYWSAGPRWGDYKLAVQPTDNYTVDRPQLETLLKYKTTVQVY